MGVKEVAFEAILCKHARCTAPQTPRPCFFYHHPTGL